MRNPNFVAFQLQIKGTHQPAHPRTAISTRVIGSLVSILFGKSVTIRETNPDSGVYKEHNG